MNEPVIVDLRFWTHVDKTDTCWLWTGFRNNDGYGVMSRGQKWLPITGHAGSMKAHRWSWLLHHGKDSIPDGLEIDHRCRVRNCVNPEHLRLTTHAENVYASPLHGAYKTHCPVGHPYDEANTYYVHGGRGGPRRGCRTCKRAQNRDRYAANLESERKRNRDRMRIKRAQNRSGVVS